MMNNDRRYNRRPRILLGITGSVAAVKGPKLALRLANELKVNVKVILTRTVEQYFWKEGKAVPSYDADSWNEFINVVVPSTTTSIVVADTNDEEDLDWRLSTGKISIHYAEEEWANYTSLQDSVLHIDLRNWADVCLIAPLSAHTLSKIANGLCDDLLTCCLRAWDYGQRNNKSLNNNSDGTIGIGKPIILAPAMNTAMWDHPLTSWQLETIKKFTRMKKDDDESNNQEEENGVYIVEPAVKTLACGEIGAGALADLDDIISAVKRCLAKWENKSNVSIDDSSSSTRKESMKRALLRHAKQRFSDMKSSHEQQLAAPISPTDIDIIETFLPRLHLNSNSLLVDLGCGDGRWLIAANKHTQCKCLGIDVDEERLRIAQESILEFDLQNMIKVRNQDAFEFVRESNDFFDANVLIIYLFREAMMKIGALMQHRLDTRGNGKNDDGSEQKKLQILCVGFALPGWASIYEEKVNGKRVYLYST